MDEENILYCLGLLENGALNYYQATKTVTIARQSIQNYIERLEEQNKKQKEVIDKATKLLESQEQDMMGNYFFDDNIAEQLLDILNEMSE